MDAPAQVDGSAFVLSVRTHAPTRARGRWGGRSRSRLRGPTLGGERRGFEREAGVLLGELEQAALLATLGRPDDDPRPSRRSRRRTPSNPRPGYSAQNDELAHPLQPGLLDGEFW